MSEWQPIETARKDSRGILGWFPAVRCVFDMVWDRTENRWDSFGGGLHLTETPTHWREMPEPPK